MAEFVISSVRLVDGHICKFTYDNQRSLLLHEDGTIVTVPIIDDKNRPKTPKKTLKISLGFTCNSKCAYCSQANVPRAHVELNLVVILDIVKQGWDRIEFWGGEPLLYWDVLKPLAEAIRQELPEAEFLLITNGSLLTLNINNWLELLDFRIGLSHDGPAQKYRGYDPFEDEKQSAIIHDLYNRLHPKHHMSFNATLHKNNFSRLEISKYFVDRFGDDVRIGEGGWIDLHGEHALSFIFDDPEEWRLYRIFSFMELKAGLPNMGIAKTHMLNFINSVRYKFPATLRRQRCQMERDDKIAINLAGERMNCQNGMEGTPIPWFERDDCPNCPLLHMCAGCCLYPKGEEWKRNCMVAWSDIVPFFCAAIDFMTDHTPYRIEGLPWPDREWLFEEVK